MLFIGVICCSYRRNMFIGWKVLLGCVLMRCVCMWWNWLMVVCWIVIGIIVIYCVRSFFWRIGWLLCVFCSVLWVRFIVICGLVWKVVGIFFFVGWMMIVSWLVFVLLLLFWWILMFCFIILNELLLRFVLVVCWRFVSKVMVFVWRSDDRLLKIIFGIWWVIMLIMIGNVGGLLSGLMLLVFFCYLLGWFLLNVLVVLLIVLLFNCCVWVDWLLLFVLVVSNGMSWMVGYFCSGLLYRVCVFMVGMFWWKILVGDFLFRCSRFMIVKENWWRNMILVVIRVVVVVVSICCRMVLVGLMVWFCNCFDFMVWVLVVEF